MSNCEPQEQRLEIVHSLNSWPGPATTTVLAAQWLVVLVPGLLVLGQVVGLAWGLDAAGRIEFMQRLLMVTAITQVVQVLWGHRLPGLVGPAAVLIVGVLATIASGPASVAGAMALGGAVTALAGFSGLAARLGRFYTPPVLAASLLLVAVSLTPTMRDLLYHPPAAGGAVSGSFLFGLGLVLIMLLAQFRLKGLWSSAALLMGLIAGSFIYYALGLEPWPAWEAGAAAGLPSLLPVGLKFEPGVIAAFLLCYLALISNELATIESTGRLINTGDMAARANRGVAASGLGGVLAGLGGVLGQVTYSVSPAMVISTKSASRWTLLPAAGATFLLALWPGGLALFGLVPEPVVGAVLLTLMAQSVYAALHVLLPEGGAPSWTAGATLGVSLIASIVVCFMPPEIKAHIHPYLRPILGNGFVMGLILALLMEQVLLRGK